MDPVIIAVLVVLCQYPIAIFSLINMFKDKLSRNATIVWDIVIIAIPFLGAAVFWICHFSVFRRRLKEKESEQKIAKTAENTTEENSSEIRQNDENRND